MLLNCNVLTVFFLDKAIALSIEKNIPLLIDDLKGRRVAEKMGIRYIGTLGLLKTAKNRGIIGETKPYILNFLSMLITTFKAAAISAFIAFNKPHPASLPFTVFKMKTTGRIPAGSLSFAVPGREFS